MKMATTLRIQAKDIKFPKNKIIEILRNGGIGAMPTDTIYGITGLALNKNTVERIYSVRKRTPSKPMIILISSIDNLKLFGIKTEIEQLNEFWPGKVSIILPCHDEKFYYLHRGANSLAFRLPNEKHLRQVISKTGPLVAPSANTEGMSPATTIEEAEKYFGNNIDFYLDGGKIEGSPSKLIKIEGGKIIEFRK